MAHHRRSPRARPPRGGPACTQRWCGAGRRGLVREPSRKRAQEVVQLCVGDGRLQGTALVVVMLLLLLLGERMERAAKARDKGEAKGREVEALRRVAVCRRAPLPSSASSSSAMLQRVQLLQLKARDGELEQAVSQLNFGQQGVCTQERLEHPQLKEGQLPQPSEQRRAKRIRTGGTELAHALRQLQRTFERRVGWWRTNGRRRATATATSCTSTSCTSRRVLVDELDVIGNERGGGASARPDPSAPRCEAVGGAADPNAVVHGTHTAAAAHRFLLDAARRRRPGCRRCR